MFIKDILDILLYIHSNIYTYVIAYIYIYIQLINWYALSLNIFHIQ